MKNNNDNNIKANREIKQINKVKSLKKKLKVRATVICYNRYCGSTLIYIKQSHKTSNMLQKPNLFDLRRY